MITKAPRDGLSPLEELLVDHVIRGEPFDLVADGEVDKATMRSWGDSRSCQASVIRDILTGRLAPHPDPHGLRLRGVRIIGRLDLENLRTEVNFELEDCLLEEGLVAQNAHLAVVKLIRCQIEHRTEPPLSANRLTCSILDLSGTTIIGDTTHGAVRLRGAHISGNLTCRGAKLRNDSGFALAADNMRADHDVFLDGRFSATGTGGAGAVRLRGCHIGGQFNCIAAELRNDSGPALAADGLEVGQDMFLRGRFTATGAGPAGAVRLPGAHIRGNLDCDGANLCNKSGPALTADYLQVDQGVFLRRGFTATGAGPDGAVRLLGAHIGGNLECDGANLCNKSGPALGADGLQVGHGVFLRCGFTATGAGPDGAVRLRGGQIGGSLDCGGAKLHNDSGPALDASGLHVDDDVYLRGGFTASGGGDGAAVDLTRMRVEGKFVFAPDQLTHAADSHRRLAVDGLTYAGVPETNAGVPERNSAQGWLGLLRNATSSYAFQPYQQLASGYRALGDDRRARETLRAQRDDQLARTHPGQWERWWGWITKVTLGYGYKPWRTLLFLAAVVIASCALAVVLGSHGALTQTSKTATPGRSCTVVQQVSVGLDLNLPVGTSMARADCDLTTDSASATAAWLTAVSWVLRLLAWAFAALFIAGFTSAVRKT